MNSLPLIRKGLRRHRIGPELLVYDSADDQVRLLDETTALVFEMMSEGLHRSEIVSKLEFGRPVGTGDELLTVALDELAVSGLLENPDRADGGATRRQVVQRLIAAGAAVVIPSVLTITAGPANAQSFGRPNGAACTANSQCASGCCAKNSAGSCTQALCSPANCGNATSCAPP